jgi:hypothetical protein
VSRVIKIVSLMLRQSETGQEESMDLSGRDGEEVTVENIDLIELKRSANLIN